VTPSSPEMPVLLPAPEVEWADRGSRTASLDESELARLARRLEIRRYEVGRDEEEAGRPGGTDRDAREASLT